MAIVLKLVRGSATVDLNDGDDGFQLGGRGWVPVVATPVYMGNPPPVTETLQLRLRQTSHNNIATYMQSLHDIQVWAEQYIKDPTEDEPVWFHAKLDNETGERRSLVRSVHAQYNTSWYGDEATALDIPLTLTVVREPYWESTTARDFPAYAATADACLVYDYTASGATVDAHDIVGDVGARMRVFNTIATTGSKYEYWMGIRSANKRGATGISNFAPIWEIESGAATTDCASAVDATASGGYSVVVTESGLDWDSSTNGGTFNRVTTVRLTDITANEGDNFGLFLWLLRAKTGTDTAWETKLRFAYGATGRWVETTPVTYNQTYWMYKESGINPIDFRNVQSVGLSDVSASAAYNYQIELHARRTSGTADLELDCLIPLPIDEGYLKYDNGELGLTTNTNFVGCSPIGSWAGLVGGAVLVNALSIESVENFTLPPGDGRIYCVSQKTDGDDITYSVTFNASDAGKYYERWLSLRGSE